MENNLPDGIDEIILVHTLQKKLHIDGKKAVTILSTLRAENWMPHTEIQEATETLRQELSQTKQALAENLISYEASKEASNSEHAGVVAAAEEKLTKQVKSTEEKLNEFEKNIAAWKSAANKARDEVESLTHALNAATGTDERMYAIDFATNGQMITAWDNGKMTQLPIEELTKGWPEKEIHPPIIKPKAPTIV